ncbi:hypothetical protein BJV74DRAFT_795195 [Russula compacta]|nr:hypothetical protein BJV74DRAFT_795195 [Russula compacta]
MYTASVLYLCGSIFPYLGLRPYPSAHARIGTRQRSLGLQQATIWRGVTLNTGHPREHERHGPMKEKEERGVSPPLPEEVNLRKGKGIDSHCKYGPGNLANPVKIVTGLERRVFIKMPLSGLYLSTNTLGTFDNSRPGKLVQQVAYQILRRKGRRKIVRQGGGTAEVEDIPEDHRRTSRHGRLYFPCGE